MGGGSTGHLNRQRDFPRGGGFLVVGQLDPAFPGGDLETLPF